MRNSPNDMAVMRDEFRESLKGLFRALFLNEADYKRQAPPTTESQLSISTSYNHPTRTSHYSPVRTIVTATAILIASSLFPTTKLTTALPSSSKINGFS